MTDKKLDILFVCPHTRAASPRAPINLACLSSYLEQFDISSEIIDVKGNYSLDESLRKVVLEVAKFDASVIGITCLATETLEVKKLCKKIREVKPKALIILGGAEPTVHPNHFNFNDGSIDFLVLGEGEIPLKELIENFKHNKRLKNIKGLAYFEKNKLVVNPRGDIVKNIDDLPSPAYSKLDMNYYTKTSFWNVRGIPLSSFFVIAARGCPYNCKFCATNIIFGKGVRFGSANYILKEVEYLIKNYNIDGLFFFDEVFTAKRQRVVDICNSMIEKKLNIIWACQTRVNLVDEELLRLMKKAGCIQVSFGVESGSQKMLDAINKAIKVDEIYNGVKLCKKVGISQFVNLMINLPGETEDDLQKTIQLARDLDPNIVVWNLTTPWPGSNMGKEMTLEEFNDMLHLSDDDFYRLINSKYRLSEHNRDFRVLMHQLFKEFPNRRKINYLPSWKYCLRVLRSVFFLYNKRYLWKVITSKRKKDYFSWYYNFVFKGKTN